MVKAEAAADVHALRELQKKIAGQAEMGKGAAQTYDAAVKGTELERIALAFDALAMIANCMAMGKADNIDHKDAGASGSASTAEKLLAGSSNAMAVLSEGRTSAETHTLIVECAFGGEMFGAGAAATGVITLEQIKRLLGAEFADFAGTLHDEMNADEVGAVQVLNAVAP